MKFVSLATDAAPAYVTLAPVTALLWKTLGYEPIVFVHADGWGQPRAQLVRRKLLELGCRLVDVPTFTPLSVANTMRSVRLVAASHPDVGDDDFVLTADIDMFPLSRTFFDRKEDFVVLRCLGDVWMQPAAPIPPRPSNTCVGMRFPMCYSGATGRIWRELFKMTTGDPSASLNATVGPHIQPYRDGDGNNVDLDERVLSYYFSRHPSVDGTVEEVSTGVWKHGGLWLIDPIDAPKLTPHDHMHRGMIHEYWWGVGDKPNGAIDFITPRFYDENGGWWGFDVAKAYFPEHADLINAYVAEARNAK